MESVAVEADELANRVDVVLRCLRKGRTTARKTQPAPAGADTYIAPMTSDAGRWIALESTCKPAKTRNAP